MKALLALAFLTLLFDYTAADDFADFAQGMYHTRCAHLFDVPLDSAGFGKPFLVTKFLIGNTCGQ